VLELYRRFAETLPVRVCTDEAFLEEAASAAASAGAGAGAGGDVIFEGAHAALLDHDYGYYPYVTKTDTTTGEAERILMEAGRGGEAVTIGVVRALGYRHGPGPFVTEDARLSGVFEERHNKGNAWQGQVRYGWFDLLAIRHGMRLNRRVHTIALTMLDQLERVEDFQVCLSYEYRGGERERLRERLEEYFDYSVTKDGRVKVTGIKPAPTRRTDGLARLLFDCAPWDWRRFEKSEDFIRFLESEEGLGVPVGVVSSGPTVLDKYERVMVR
jgi:adenylosuccinate synthase